MKKYLFGLIAVVFAVASVAFTTVKSAPSKDTFTTYYFVYSDAGSVTSLSSYQTPSTNPEVLPCNAAGVLCGFIANTSTPTLSDVNADSHPDLSGGVIAIRDKAE